MASNTHEQVVPGYMFTGSRRPPIPDLTISKKPQLITKFDPVDPTAFFKTPCTTPFTGYASLQADISLSLALLVSHLRGTTPSYIFSSCTIQGAANFGSWFAPVSPE